MVATAVAVAECGNVTGTVAVRIVRATNNKVTDQGVALAVLIVVAEWVCYHSCCYYY